MSRRLWPILIVMLVTACGPTVGQPTTTGSTTTTLEAESSRRAGWEMDLLALIDVRESIHPEPWHGISRDEYVSAVESVIARIDSLSDDELLVEVTRLAAMPSWAGRDGHGGIYPWGEGTYGTNLYPLRLYWFSDGLFVVDALAPYEDLIGKRLVEIAGHPIDQVLDAVEPMVPRDNHMQVLSHSPRLVVVAEILHGLGFIDDPTAPVELTFSAENGEEIVDVATVPVARFEGAVGGHHTHSPPQDPDGARWLRNINDTAWWELDAPTKTAYLAYNFTASITPVVNEIRSAIVSGDVDRLVVDVRHNPGGNNQTYGPLLDLVRDAADQLPRGTYVAMGRATFSAAGNFVTEVDLTTEALLVGEDSGTSPNQYGDSAPTTLTHSGLVFRVGRFWVMRSDPDDPRITVEPDIEAPLSSSDYFTGTDPVWEAILGHG